MAESEPQRGEAERITELLGNNLLIVALPRPKDYDPKQRIQIGEAIVVGCPDLSFAAAAAILRFVADELEDRDNPRRKAGLN